MPTFEEIFQKAAEETDAATSKNTLHGVIQALVTGNPGHYLTAKTQNRAIEAKQGIAKQFFQVPEFATLPPQYQELAANFAGRGDIDEVQQTLQQGRKHKEDLDEAELKKAGKAYIQEFKQSLSPAAVNFYSKLVEKNPQAAISGLTSFGKSVRSEERQGLQDVSQEGRARLQDIKGSGLTDTYDKFADIHRKALQQKDPTSLFSMKPKALSKKLGVSPQDAQQYLNTLNATQQQGVQIQAPGFLDQAKSLLFQTPLQQPIPPQQVGQEVFKALPKEQQQALQQKEALEKQQASIQGQQSQEKFLTQPKSITLYDPVSKQSKTVKDTPQARSLAKERRLQIK